MPSYRQFCCEIRAVWNLAAEPGETLNLTKVRPREQISRGMMTPCFFLGAPVRAFKLPVLSVASDKNSSDARS